MDNPFSIVVYDKDFVFQGFVADPGFAYFVPAWRAFGYGNFMLDADNPHTEALQAEGARVTVQYRGKHLLSGPVRSRRGSILPGGTVTYQVSDDRRIIRNTLAWVNPGHTLEAQSLSDPGQAWQPAGTVNKPGKTSGQFGYYLWPEESVIPTTEAAIKHILKVNLVTRLGWPVVIEPDLGRGGNIAAAGELPTVRFELLEEIVEPMLDYGGLGLKVWQPLGAKAIHIDVFEPSEWPQNLTPESGIVRFGEYAVSAPDATRTIIGGPGEGLARVFAGSLTPGVRTQREIDYNDIIEVFRDGTGYEMEFPEGTPDDEKVAKYYEYKVSDKLDLLYDQHMHRVELAGLLEGAPKSGLSVTLAETDTFHFGGADGIQIGDKVTIKSGGVDFTDRLTQAEISFTRDEGLKVTPVVGEKADDPDDQLADAISRLSRALRNTATKK